MQTGSTFHLASTCGFDCNVSQHPAGGNSAPAEFGAQLLCCGRGGSAHSLVIKALLMSHKEGVGGGWGRVIERRRRKRRRRGAGWGGLHALPPGVLSRCQEADRFLLSGHESAGSVFPCQGPCLSIYLLQHIHSQHAASSPFRRRGGQKCLQERDFEDEVCQIDLNK